MSRIKNLFEKKQRNILNIYCTAGYPNLDSTKEVLLSLQEAGADLIELGMPYSDPLADGAVIQASSSRALQNGMSISTLFDQLKDLRKEMTVPIILMGYLNPILQYGFEKFCDNAASAGIDGLIIPDIPMQEYIIDYQATVTGAGLDFIFLVTPETTKDRIRKLDELSSGFLYAVSSSSITGTDKSFYEVEAYLQRLNAMQLKNPVLVGFGIKDRQTFESACKYANGAIIGSAYVKAIENAADIRAKTKEFVSQLGI